MQTIWQRVVMILTLRCDEATLLMSESIDRKLRLHEWLAIRGHVLVCKGCRMAKKQLAIVGAALKRQRESSEGLSPEQLQLSPQARARIKQQLSDPK